jgi:UrcA family protein
MKTFFTLAAVAALTPLAPATAQTTYSDTLSRSVRVADLNLADPAQVARLDARIHRAARAMCRIEFSSVFIARKRVRECVSKVLADSAAQRDRAIAGYRGLADIRTANR